jgi:uncharacterized Zn-finger protein
MATPDTGIPHFHNDVGVATIHVGSKEFMCIGALPPFDHPHIFIDMGDEGDAICGYCGTHFRYKPSLGPGQAEPAECLWRQEKAA